MNKLWKEYEVPEEIIFKVPRGLPGVKKHQGKTIFYTNLFALGVKLPFHLEFAHFLRVMKLTPSQLSPNA